MPDEWVFDLQSHTAEFRLSLADSEEAERQGYLVLPAYRFPFPSVECAPERIYDITYEDGRTVLTERTTGERLVVEKEPLEVRQA